MCVHADEHDRQAEVNTTMHIAITVRGRLSDRLATAFEGLVLERRRGETELSGEVADQTQLHALLARIRDLGLALESVKVVEPSNSSGEDRRLNR